MRFKVFISHSTKDLPLVEELEHWLALNGVEAYVAARDIRPGAELKAKIADQIRDSDCVLAIMTQDGAGSQWVHQEIGCAKQAGKLVVPIVEEGVAVQGFLEGIEYVPFRRHDPYDAINRVIQFLYPISVRKREQEVANLILASTLIFFGGLLLGAVSQKEPAVSAR